MSKLNLRSTGTCVLRGLSMVSVAFGGYAVTLPAAAQTTGHTAAHAQMEKDAMPMDMHSSMTNMQQQMSAVKASGNVDEDFAVMMRIHHQGAVDMAEMELKKGKDPQMKAMATEIIAAQKKEIAQFDQWIADHKKPQK